MLNQLGLYMGGYVAGYGYKYTVYYNYDRFASRLYTQSSLQPKKATSPCPPTVATGDENTSEGIRPLATT